MKLLSELKHMAEFGLKTAGHQVTERYEGSSDFDADMVAIQTKLGEIKSIMTSPNWIHHMRDTESNFEVDGLGTAENHLFSCIEEAEEAADEFYELIQKAS